jgi:hypothetical protein
VRRGSVYLSFTSHRTEAREALEGTAFAGFRYSSGISSSSTTQWSLCSGSSKGTNLRNAAAEIGDDRQPDPLLLARPTLEGEWCRARVYPGLRYCLHHVLELTELGSYLGQKGA